MLAFRCWTPHIPPTTPFTKILCVNTPRDRHSSTFTKKPATKEDKETTALPSSLQDKSTILKKDEAVQLVSGVLGLVEDYLKRVNLEETEPEQASSPSLPIPANTPYNLKNEGENHLKNLQQDINKYFGNSRPMKIEEIDHGITKLKYILARQTSRRGFEQRSAGHLAQSSYRASYYRGGTSRAIIFNYDDIPMHKPQLRDSIFLQAIGSPDPHGRQLNGMGAGVSSLSKICIVKRNRVDMKESQQPHLDYTFVGMGIEGDEVDFAGNCGNMAAAIGPYAFNRRIIPGFTGYAYKEYFKDRALTLLIRNTNTNVMIRSTFAIRNGEAVVDDSTPIDGVSGLGTRVLLDFLKPGGSKTSKLLPTGNAVDTINGFQVSCVDSANPCVFLRASDLDIDPTILPTQFLAMPEKLQKLEEIRAAAAVMMGLCQEGEKPARVIPKIAIVSPPVDQTVLSGEVNPADSLDLVIRFISDGQPHRASPLTGALCTATAAKIPGTVVQQCVRETPVTSDLITIGHSSGRIQVDATMDADGDVECVSVVRTTRRIMDGEVYATIPLTKNPGLQRAEMDDQTEDMSEEE